MLSSELTSFCERLLPRMLTQVCRDPNLSEYGAFDRNWWHYKVRDFSSIILQQGGYALYCASLLEGMEAKSDVLQRLAGASAKFWNKRACKFHAFEEYYPWEQGYPPVAFSTLAVAKLAGVGAIPIADVYEGLKNAAAQLLSRFETKATNQQVAGTAALCWIRKVAPELVDERRFSEICRRTLDCQHQEGWYMEYGGPDLGYLAVTMDCLWDAFDATGDQRFRDSSARALAFIDAFTRLPGRGAGMHNARNTDYIVPYGIARFLEDQDMSGKAWAVIERVFENISDPEHFLHAVDDRYFCHYIGHSLFRSLSLIRKAEALSVSGVEECTMASFPGTGHFIFPRMSFNGAALISAKKGGVFTVWFKDAPVSDFGWVVSTGNSEWVSHWWGDFWSIDQTENSVTVEGFLTPCKSNESTPSKHLALRGMSLLMGRRIIGLLKEWTLNSLEK